MARLSESVSAESLLARTVRGIRGADAKARQQVLTKPEGSLGLLEDLSIRLAGMYGQVPVPVPSHPVVGLFAGDHGVWAQGVSPDPQEITTQQMVNMAAGGAAISVLSRQMGAQLWITDVGALHEVDAPIRQRCVRRGTDDISQGLTRPSRPLRSVSRPAWRLSRGEQTSSSLARWASRTRRRPRHSSASSPGAPLLR